jgi:DNA helicase-2/ATP-dependent DNA helicase PcrA
MTSYSDNDAFEAAPAPRTGGKPSLSQRATAAPQMDYFEGLNSAQRQAVETLDGPVLMLAGAGTGKTKALTCRIAHLMATGRARPDEILAVTFTNKAAREMKNRIGGLTQGASEGMRWLGTFHAICVKLLRRHSELVGLKSSFTILDTDDQLRLLKQLVRAAGIDDKRWPPRMLAGIIDGWKNKAWTPAQVPMGESGAFDKKGLNLYAAYQQRLKDLNACDFGDLLLHMVTIFQTHADVLASYQSWFKYILVDEYQDTNVAQYLWLRLLAQGHKNICCVGDDDQSIYGWRGAEVGNILRFEKDFPGAHVVRLEQNYRSTGHILGAAGGVIDANKDRLGKALFTNGEDGEQVRLIGHWDGEEEARWIGEDIEAMLHGTRGHDAINLNSMAILVRASHQMRSFEDRFLTIGLPYRVIGGPRFYERMEVRVAMSYFRLAVSQDDDLAFERIVNTPKRGLGEKAVQTIQKVARSNGVNLIEGARLCVDGGLIKGRGGNALGELLKGIDRWYQQLHGQLNGARRRDTADDSFFVIDDGPTVEVFEGASNVNHVELAEVILDECGYTAHWQNEKTPEAPGRLENLKELIKALENFDSLQGFLEHISLILDNAKEEKGDMVTIMTLHGAKGLEFPSVYLPGWEDGLFPSQRSMDESGVKGLEEERRLAYVGITRAEKHCTISFTSSRLVYGQWQSQMPSRFIDELPEINVEVLTPPGLYGGGFGAAGMSAQANPASEGMASTLHDKMAKADVYNSPGWRRLQSRSQQRSITQPKEARNSVIDMTATSSFTTGERVFHQKFGYGFVMEIEGDKLLIEFDKAGDKKVVAKFIVSADSANDVPF